LIHPDRNELSAAFSGLLLAFSFPKFGHGAVAWIALAPLLLVLPGAGGWLALRLGYIMGAVSSLGLLYWTSLVVMQYGDLSFPASIMVMFLLCLAVALFPCLFAWLTWCWVRALGPVALLLSPIAWVATEVLRAYTFFRFPWCLLGYSQAINLPFVQIASWTAVYGVSFLVALSSAVLAHSTFETSPVRRLRVVLGFVGLLLLVGCQGLWALSRPLRVTGRIRVGLVQASVLQEDKWEASKAQENVERHVSLTQRIAGKGPRLVVWPESAVPFDYDQDQSLRAELQDLVKQRLYLIFGNDDQVQSPDGPRIYVGAKMLSPSGELVLRYRKMRLVPFGEYVPLKPLLTLGGRYAAKLVQQVSDFSSGSEHSVVRVDGHLLGTFICYEAIFPDLVRGFAARGAEVLVNITNDAWYGRTSAPFQHFAMARFRAVESGKYLVRAANTGISAVVDPCGRVVDRTGLFESTTLVADVPTIASTTFYARHGDVFGWGCVGAALTLTAGAFVLGALPIRRI